MGSSMNKMVNEIKLDLSKASDTTIELILLRVPPIELVKLCTKVSKQWDRILSKKGFWTEKWEYDGYKLPHNYLSILNKLTVINFKKISLKRPFNRNLLRDHWDEGFNFHKDSRWHGMRDVLERTNDHMIRSGRWYRTNGFIAESPPIFLSYLDNTVEACLTTDYSVSMKRIVIKLEDEGLTPDIMDRVRPTIAVSELVAHRADCASWYKMECILRTSEDQLEMDQPPSSSSQMSDDQNCKFIMEKRSIVGQVERWEEVRHEFKSYPAGIRYLVLTCYGKDLQLWAGHYGSKMANCSITVVSDTNISPDSLEKPTTDSKPKTSSN